MFCMKCGTSLPQSARFCSRCGVETVGIPDWSPSGASPVPSLAGTWLRIAACVIDAALLWLPSLFILVGLQRVLAGALQSGASLQESWIPIAAAYAGIWVVRWLYFALMHGSRWQATVGKQAVGIKVVSLDGERITFARASLRYLGNLLEILTFGVGLLMAAFTRRRQALHDIIGGTLVTTANATPDDVRRGLQPKPESKLLLALVLAAPMLFLAGVFGLIAIGTHGDLELHRQVDADRALAQPYTTAVEAAIGDGWPVNDIDNATIGLPEAVQSRYLASIEVSAGMVRLWYGDRADPSLQDQVLTLTPAFGADGKVTWLCGYAAAPAGVTPVDEEYQEFTTVPFSAMPSDCR